MAFAERLRCCRNGDHPWDSGGWLKLSIHIIAVTKACLIEGFPIKTFMPFSQKARSMSHRNLTRNPAISNTKWLAKP